MKCVWIKYLNTTREPFYSVAKFGQSDKLSHLGFLIMCVGADDER